MGGYTKTPSQVFKTEEAQCVSSALFGKLVLYRAGYKTFLRHVAWGNWANESHAGAGIITDDGRYILVVDFGPRAKPISEPYDTIAELDEVLAGRRKIVRRMWGTYFKPGD